MSTRVLTRESCSARVVPLQQRILVSERKETLNLSLFVYFRLKMASLHETVQQANVSKSATLSLLLVKLARILF